MRVGNWGKKNNDFYLRLCTIYEYYGGLLLLPAVVKVCCGWAVTCPMCINMRM